MAKNGWGAARDGKVLKSTQTNERMYGEYSMTDVKPSSDLRGLYSKYQGSTLKGTSEKNNG